MRATRRLRFLAVLILAVFFVTGCITPQINGSTPEQATESAGNGGEAEEQKPESITVTWLAYSGSGGTTGTTVISRKAPEKEGDFRIEFSENEVGGIGAQSQAGAWNAAIISTLLLNQPLEGSFRFETDGRIDGPSAGALTTAGLMALARGDEIDSKTTMTGTINATGPVGGIPEKVKAAGEEGFTKVLIPLGQRMSRDAKGQQVDVIKLGDRDNVEVLEVGDIYEAYHELTGVDISAPQQSRDPRLSADSYDKVRPQAQAALARFDTAVEEFNALPGEIKTVFVDGGMVEYADALAKKAENLQQQGLQAGAYNMANQAAAFMEAFAATGELIQPLFTQGLAGLDQIFTRALNTKVADRAEGYRSNLLR